MLVAEEYGRITKRRVNGGKNQHNNVTQTHSLL